MKSIHKCFDTCEIWCYEAQPKCEKHGQIPSNCSSCWYEAQPKCEKHGQIPSNCSSCWYEAQPKCIHEEVSTNCLKCKY